MERAEKTDRNDNDNALHRMIWYLANDPIPQSVARENLRGGFKHSRSSEPYNKKNVTSVNELAFALGYLNHSSLYPPNQKFSDRTEAMIKDLYSIHNECWKFFYKRDATSFITAYDRLHAAKIGGHEKLQPGGDEAPDRTPLVPLQWDAWADEPRMGTPYAYLTLRTGNLPVELSPDPGQIHLGFDLNCPLVLSDKVEMGIKRCLLIFDCGRGHTGALSARTGNAGGVVFEGAHFCTYGPDTRMPSWMVTATGDGVIGKVETVPATFICIDLLKPGSTVKAWIRANVKEIRTHFVVPDDEQAESEAKRKIKARVKLLADVDGEDGDVVFAKSEIKLMARDGGAKPDPEG